MSTTAVATTLVYRNKVALAAAHGTALPKINRLAFSESAAAYDPGTETAVPGQFHVATAAASVSGAMLTATATLKGADVGTRVLRSVAALAEDGTLVGRKVITPKEFEPETEMDFELFFQY